MTDFVRLTWLILFSLFAGSACRDDVKWGTYRPHALISVRARVPHSPYFGIVWHRPNNFDIRHLADHPQISYFGWSRHNGDTFGDHEVIDPNANAAIISSFVKTDDGKSWALRISGKPLEKEIKDANKLSVIFYAATGPEENVGAAEEDVRRPWGTMELLNDVEREGVAGEVGIKGISETVGGRWKIALLEPVTGTVHTDQQIENQRLWRLGRRKRREARWDDIVRYLQRWHVAGPKGGPEHAWKIEEKLRGLLEGARADGRDPLDEEELLDESEEYRNAGSEHENIVTLPNTIDGEAPTLFVQRILHLPFQFDVIFSDDFDMAASAGSESSHSFTKLRGSNLNVLLESRRAEFDHRFNSIFGLKAPNGVDQRYGEIGRRALANVLGGIGYFYGSPLVRRNGASSSDHRVEILPRVGLLSATPSRAVFPRGFLWDEGFHQLVIQRWDTNLSRDCIKSWYSTMQHDGWIPREQILGIEARERFPAHIRHLVLQDPEVANPPTLLMPLRVFASMEAASVGNEAADSCHSNVRGVERCGSATAENVEFLSSISSKVSKNYEWLRTTQSGERAGTFRWRGRSLKHVGPEGHPLTFASGMDDFPRAETPNVNETHLDLYSWVTWGSSALEDISRMSSPGLSSSNVYRSLRKQLMSGIHTSSGAKPEMICDSDGRSKVCHRGYVTLFPLMLGLLDEDDARVGDMLTWLEDRDILRSIAGVRSLSKSDPWFGKGDNYWTGPTWMPFNFLILGSLKIKYARRGRFKVRARKVYESLRKDVLSNVQRVFDTTGFLWEQYGEQGEGRRGKQFTGWTATVLLIAGEMYEGIL